MVSTMEWMPRLLLECLVVLSITRFVTVPILMIVHELGHAAAVVRAGQRPVIVVGNRPPIFMRDFRRFDLLLHPAIGFDYFRFTRDEEEEEAEEDEHAHSHIARCTYSPVGLTVKQLRSISMSGPRASLLAAIVLAEVTYLLGDPHTLPFWLAALGAAFALYEGITTMIPLEVGELSSDGARLAELRGLDDDEVPTPFPTDHLGRNVAPPVAAAQR
jgi:hypothetical protein